jgi:hypothetical protein
VNSGSIFKLKKEFEELVKIKENREFLIFSFLVTMLCMVMKTGRLRLLILLRGGASINAFPDRSLGKRIKTRRLCLLILLRGGASINAFPDRSLGKRIKSLSYNPHPGLIENFCV